MGKVSIIIPCYNVELFVEKCIDSVINQSYKDLEIICINDGSTDGTLQRLNHCQNKDPRIKVISQENKGLSETRNIGIEQAYGEWIMFVDSDDWLEPNCIEETFAPEHDLVCFSYNRIFKNGREPRALNLSGTYRAAEIQRRITGLTGTELEDPSQANSLVTACAKIYRTAIIRENEVRFLSTRQIGTEDALFNLQYLQACTGTVLVIDRPYYNYLRYNATSLTTTYKPALFSQWNTLHELMFDLIKNKTPDFQEAFYNRIALSIVGLGLNEMENPQGFRSQMKKIKEILKHPLYINSYRQLNFQFFPLPWKILFLMAKYKVTIGVYLMMKLMSMILKRKNK